LSENRLLISIPVQNFKQLTPSSFKAIPTLGASGHMYIVIMRSSLWGRIKRCTCPSLSLSVRPVPRIFSKKRIAAETSNLVETRRWLRATIGANLSSKGQRSRSLGTKMYTIVFEHIFFKNASIYVKPTPKWSPAHSTDIFEYISPAEMFRLCDNL